MLYLDGQGKNPADKGTFRGGDFTLKPDAPDSVLRIGCRADGDTWRYVRSHLRGLLDELQDQETGSGFGVWGRGGMPSGIRPLIFQRQKVTQRDPLLIR